MNIILAEARPEVQPSEESQTQYLTCPYCGLTDPEVGYHERHVGGQGATWVLECRDEVRCVARAELRQYGQISPAIIEVLLGRMRQLPVVRKDVAERPFRLLLDDDAGYYEALHGVGGGVA